MTPKRLLSEAPLRLRLASTALSASLLAGLAGFYEALAAGLGAAALIASSSLLPVITSKARRALASRFSGYSNGLDKPQGLGPRPFKAYHGFEIEFTGASQTAVQDVSKLIIDRSRVGGSRIAVASILEGGRGRVIVLLSSEREDQLRIDYEVLKTMIASTVKGVKIREAGESELRLLASLAEAVEPSGKPAALIVGGYRDAGSNGFKGLRLGYRSDSPLPEKVYLTVEDVEGHIAVFGSTGTGKSTTLAVLACGASEELGFSSVIIDWTGEHSGKADDLGCGHVTLDPLKDLRLNPLIEASGEDDIIAIVDALASSLGLSEPQAYLLMRALEESKPSTLEELEAVIEGAPEASKWDRDVKRALLRKIAALTRGSSKQAFSGREYPSKLSIAGGRTLIVDVSRIQSIPARRAYSLLLLWLLHKTAKSTGSKVLAVVDEAHNISGGEDSLLSKLAAESRKDGLYLALATQSPSLMPVRVLANTNTKIVHALRSHRDLEVVKTAMYLPEDYAQRLPSLEKGEALLHSPSHPQPIFVKISR